MKSIFIYAALVIWVVNGCVSHACDTPFNDIDDVDRQNSKVFADYCLKVLFERGLGFQEASSTLEEFMSDKTFKNGNILYRSNGRILQLMDYFDPKQNAQPSCIIIDVKGSPHDDYYKSFGKISFFPWDESQSEMKTAVPVIFEKTHHGYLKKYLYSADIECSCSPNQIYIDLVTTQLDCKSRLKLEFFKLPEDKMYQATFTLSLGELLNSHQVTSMKVMIE